MRMRRAYAAFLLFLTVLLVSCTPRYTIKTNRTETPIETVPTSGDASTTGAPTVTPTDTPTVTPSDTPTVTPSDTPTITPSDTPTVTPSDTPTVTPSDTPTVTPSDTPTVTPTVPGDRTLVSSASILTAGDNLLHSGLLKDGHEHAGDGEYFNFDFVYKKIKDQVSAADYAIINQESIILHEKYLPKKDTVDRKYYRSDGSFVTPTEMLGTLSRLGFDAIDMANNHALDMGSAGLQWSLDYLHKQDDLLFFGAYYDDADRAGIRVAEVNGIRIALLAYTYGTNVPSERAHGEEPEFRFVVPYIDDEKMIAELRAADEIADFTAVFMHWGTEYSFEPDELQLHAAKVLAENGAGIIIGHHSHTLQPIEYLDNGRGGKVLCAYGLGTLVSNMDTDVNMLSGLFSFRVNKWDDGSVTVSEPLLTPTVFYYNMSFRASELMYLSELTPEMAASHGIGNYPKGASKRNSMSVEGMYGYLHGSISDEFLPAEYRK